MLPYSSNELSKGIEVSHEFFPIKKVAQIFSVTQNDLLHLVQTNKIPPFQRHRHGVIEKKGWFADDLFEIGKVCGFFQPFGAPKAVAVFTTKGGVLKSTLATNLARIAALHGMKTCVVGLDIQGDITSALGHDPLENGNDDNMGELIEQLDQTKGLYDIFNSQSRIEETILATDLPNLYLIPETPELVALNEAISNINRREYWLKEKIVDRLKKNFDLVIMDCSPNWNKLTTNALVACDALISPIECKINNFRNFRVFRHFLNEFKEDMRLDFTNIMVPTRYSPSRKLSMDIKEWYYQNVENCLPIGIKESIIGEEAMALNKSIIEHAPAHKVTAEVKQVFQYIHEYISNTEAKESFQNYHTGSEERPWHLA